MKPFKVLIVEDDPFVALDLEDIVKAQEDAEVALVSSIREGEQLCRGGVDLALLDIDVVDGKTFGLAQSLKRQKIEFAFVSASSPEEVPEDLRKASFIPKPFRRSDIERLLHARTAMLADA